MVSWRTGILLGVIALAGCATGQRAVRVSLPVTENAGDGIDVRLDSVRDVRAFQVATEGLHSTAGVRSSRTGGFEVDESRTPRLIGRVLNHDWIAMGEVLLEPEWTVERVVSAVMADSLRANGYRVLSRQDRGFDAAAPLDVEISRFWMWTGETNALEVQLVLLGPVEPFLEGVQILSSTESRGPLAVASGRFQESLDAGLAGLRRDAEAQLRDARTMAGTGGGESSEEPTVGSTSDHGGGAHREPPGVPRSWCDPDAKVVVWIQNQYGAYDETSRRDDRRVSTVASRADALDRELAKTLERRGVPVDRNGDAVAVTVVVALTRRDVPSDVARFFYIRKSVHSVAAVLELYDGNAVGQLKARELLSPRLWWTPPWWKVEFDPKEQAEILGEQVLSWRESECGF